MIRYFDMFAWIGGFRAGLTRANVTVHVIEAIGCRLQAVDEALCREGAA